MKACKWSYGLRLEHVGRRSAQNWIQQYPFCSIVDPLDLTCRSSRHRPDSEYTKWWKEYKGVRVYIEIDLAQVDSVSNFAKSHIDFYQDAVLVMGLITQQARKFFRLPKELAEALQTIRAGLVVSVLRHCSAPAEMPFPNEAAIGNRSTDPEPVDLDECAYALRFEQIPRDFISNFEAPWAQLRVIDPAELIARSSCESETRILKDRWAGYQGVRISARFGASQIDAAQALLRRTRHLASHADLLVIVQTYSPSLMVEVPSCILSLAWCHNLEIWIEYRALGTDDAA